MRAYVYQAALLCEDCAKVTMEGLNLEMRPADSDRYPQGPYDEGGGEADCPQHCDMCGVFLENELTDDGRKYVAEQIAMMDLSSNPSPVVAEWREYYGDTL